MTEQSNPQDIMENARKAISDIRPYQVAIKEFVDAHELGVLLSVINTDMPELLKLCEFLYEENKNLRGVKNALDACEVDLGFSQDENRDLKVQLGAEHVAKGLHELRLENERLKKDNKRKNIVMDTAQETIEKQYKDCQVMWNAIKGTKNGLKSLNALRKGEDDPIFQMMMQLEEIGSQVSDYPKSE